MQIRLAFSKQGNMTVEETRRSGIVERDGVHLVAQANRNAAVLMCDRIRKGEIMEKEMTGASSGPLKKARW
jgi:hypothetical protein